MKSIYGERNSRPNLGNICQAFSNLFSNVPRCIDVKINGGSNNDEVLESRCMGSIFLRPMAAEGIGKCDRNPKNNYKFCKSD